MSPGLARVQALASPLPKYACAALERLRVSDCEHFTDAGLAALAPLSRCFSWLHLSRLPSIAGGGFSHLASFTRLRNLKFGSVRQIVHLD